MAQTDSNTGAADRECASRTDIAHSNQGELQRKVLKRRRSCHRSSICTRYAFPIPFASAGMLRLDSRVPLLGNGPFPTNYFFSIPGAGLGARSFLNVTPSFMTKTTFSIALMF